MKIQKRKQIPQKTILQKPFIGRTLQVNRFWNEYELHKNSDNSEWLVSVLNYYGMGGIGKTELANELATQTDDKGMCHIYFTFDTNKSFLENIIEMRSVFCRELNISFPLFDVAYITYCEKSGRKIGEIEKFTILNSRWMEAIYPMLNIMPKINIAAAILQVMKPFEQELGRIFSEKDFDFSRMSPDKLYENLVYFFCCDLNCYVERNQPFPVFIDNIDGIIMKEEYIFKEWFLATNGLIQQLSNIIWCFFSRTPIDDSLFPEKTIQYILVDEFDYEETKKYLENCLVDNKFWLKIYEVTKGIPLYLDISVETYYMLIRERKEVNIIELGSDKEKLLLSFYKHLNAEEKKCYK